MSCCSGGRPGEKKWFQKSEYALRQAPQRPSGRQCRYPQSGWVEEEEEYGVCVTHGEYLRGKILKELPQYLFVWEDKGEK